MDTPGNVLRSERERQSKSLKEVARKLKVNIKYLEAIEDDDYSVLPAEVFARSYIRLYADELDLDSSGLLELFENIGKAPDAEKPEQREEAAVPPPSTIEQKKSFRPLLFVVAAGLLILILALVSQKKEEAPGDTHGAGDTALLHETKPADGESEGQSVKAVPEVAARIENTKAAARPEESLAQDSHRPAQPAPRGSQVNSAGEMTLTIFATELTWVSLSIDGRSPTEWQLRPGQTVTVKGRKGFSGKIGNAGGTRLSFNNEDLGNLGPPGKIIDITLPR